MQGGGGRGLAGVVTFRNCCFKMASVYETVCSLYSPCRVHNASSGVLILGVILLRASKMVGVFYL